MITGVVVLAGWLFARSEQGRSAEELLVESADDDERAVIDV
jgi:hypothetical protein